MRFSAACAIAMVLGGAADVEAHFKLNSPINRSQQDLYGSPQKSAPCGLTDSATVADQSVPTNVVTAMRTGSLLTISINETIFHPGHYRVALAADMASLPADPPVTPGVMDCGTTTIDPSPALPVLADGLLVHTSSAHGALQTMNVQLPAGMTCTNCVLQVTEFMSDHPLNNPGGCFYHHCAIITLADDAPPPPPPPVDPDAGVDEGGGTVNGGCGCATSRSRSHPLLAIPLGLLVLTLLVRRRR